MIITTKVAQELINNQFPQWNHLEIKPVEKDGHDNRTFHLGTEMTIRMPSGVHYVAQVEKELVWLPILARSLSIPITSPIGKGQPGACYPFPWLINRYIKGDTLNETNGDKMELAIALANFLKELQAIDTTNAPVAGPHNFYRGGNLLVYQEETEEALLELRDELPTETLRQLWQLGTASRWSKKDVWLHGDIAPGNLLVRNGELCGVIDFGIMGVGDPACDYAMAWTFFDQESRIEFLKGLDKDMVDRARGWALWKALITYRSDCAHVLHCAKKTILSMLDETR